jgi:hypothetical protein
MTEKFNYTMRQNSQEADDKRVIIREGSLSHKRNKKDAAPILRVEKTSIKITYYISFIFIVYFICGILFDTLSQENMTVFEVSKRNVHVMDVLLILRRFRFMLFRCFMYVLLRIYFLYRLCTSSPSR